MQHTPDTDKENAKAPAVAPTQVVEVADALSTTPPAKQLFELLSSAAALAVSMDIDLDGWMKSAWSVYVDTRPGLREQIEEMQLMAQLNALRQSGRIGQA